MDNEEIRKLIRGLKEASDESSSVRTRVVKIHFDTPEEAERRKRAKRKAEAEEIRRKQEEEAMTQAAEEERRHQAELAAEEAVRAAKNEARAGFSADLEADLRKISEEPEAEEEKAFSVHFPGTTPEKTSDDTDKKPAALEPDGSSDDEEMPETSERGGIFSLFGRMRRSAGRDMFDADAEDTEENNGSPESAEAGSGRVDSAEAPAGRAGEAKVSSESSSRRFFRTLAGKAEQMKEDLKKDLKQRTVEQNVSYSDDKEFPDDRGFRDDTVFTDGVDHFPDQKKQREETSGSALSQDRVPSEKTSAVEKGTPKTAGGRFSGLKSKLMNLFPEDDDDDFYDDDDEDEVRKQDSIAKKGAAEARTRKAGAVVKNEESEDVSATDEAADPLFRTEEQEKDDWKKRMESPVRGPRRHIRIPKKPVIPLPKPGSHPEEEPEDAAEDALKQTSDEPLRTPQTEMSSEKKGRKDISDQDASELQEDLPGQDIRGFREDTEDTEETEETETRKSQGHFPKLPASGNIKSKIPELKIRKPQSKKPFLIGGAVLIVLILVFVVLTIVIPKSRSRRQTEITVDEGLSVQVLSQPQEFCKEGDISIRVRASEPIQSITVNGENVAITQGKTVEFTYHAEGGTLEIMVVSTDKVRSAKVRLAYVDSEPPAVTAAEKDGKLELSAVDTESGVDRIYVGTYEGISEIPAYELYTEPVALNPGKVMSYYAVDEAGNRSAPVTTRMTPAESIAFVRDTYSLYPGTEAELKIKTTPENAFISNLSLEIENPKVAQLADGMKIRGLTEGDTRITASADGLAPITATVSVAKTRTVKISVVGDCTLGTDEQLSQNTSFSAYQTMYGNQYFFENVRDILDQDDATFANFEGTLTTSTARASKQFAFKGDPDYVNILKDGSIEVVTLANNHSSDYGSASLTDTEAILEEAGIGWCEGTNVAYAVLNGVKTAFIGVYSLDNGTAKQPEMEACIAAAKEAGAGLIIVYFHWGNELVEEVDEYQKTLAHAAVDAGASLVVGSHSHILGGIEKYKGVYIAYGMSNFCFGGNSNPHSMDSMIFQQTFTFTEEGLQNEDDIRIIPCRISSDTMINNYQPTPASGEAADAIMKKIDELSAPFGQTYAQYMVDGYQAAKEKTA